VLGWRLCRRGPHRPHGNVIAVRHPVRERSGPGETTEDMLAGPATRSP